MLMHIFTKGFVATLTALLAALLFVLAFDVGLVRTVGSPSTVKKVLADSGIYSSVVPTALTEVGKISTSVGDIPLSDSSIRSAATQSFTPQQIESYSNEIIDSIYTWLEGKTDKPTFRIDLTASRDSLADNIAATLQQRLATLPVCTSFSGTGFDAYSATCLPPGVSAAQAAAEVKSQLLSGQGFLDQPVITSDNIEGSGDGKSPFDNQSVPENYQRLKKAPFVVGLLALLVAAGIVFLSATRRRGLRRIGIILAAVGIFMMVFAWGLNKLFTTQALPRINFESAVVEQEVKSVATDLEQAVSSNYWTFGIIYAVLGAGLFAGTRFLFVPKTTHQAMAEPGDEKSASGRKP